MTSETTSHQIVIRRLPANPLQDRRQLVVGCRTHGEHSTTGDWHDAKVWVQSHCGPSVNAESMLRTAGKWPRGRAS